VTENRTVSDYSQRNVIWPMSCSAYILDKTRSYFTPLTCDV